MNIINPLSPTGTKEHISTVLHALAGQGGCDGVPYDQMQLAADYILDLEQKKEKIMQLDINFNDDVDLNIHNVPTKEFEALAKNYAAKIIIRTWLKYFSFTVGKVEITLFEEQ